MSKVRVRFAPSPTGPLHIGGVRTALYNYLFAKKQGGDFILRIEDTDQKRYVQGAEDYILKALEWCGIAPNEGVGNDKGDFGPYRQSERKEIYQKYVQQLIEQDKAYYAFDTPEELDQKRDAVENWKYDYNTRAEMKNSLSLSEDQTQALLATENYTVRIKIPADQDIYFNDLVRGEIKINTSSIDDKVIFKSDGLPTYHLANIVDDHLMQISHVIRGEEWLPSTPLHVILYDAFGWRAPEFAHLPLILKPEGKGKLSKRDGDRLGFPVFPLQWKDPATGEISSGYKESGYLNSAVVNMLAFLGWNPGTEQELFSLSELEKSFDLSRVGKSGARFDADKAKWFNAQYIKNTEDAVFADHLKQHFEGFDQDYYRSVAKLFKERITFFSELKDKAAFFFSAPEHYDEKTMKKKWKDDSGQIVQDLAKIFNDTDFSSYQLKQAFEEYVQAKEIGFGKAMIAVRLTLTGKGAGPDLFESMQILGVKEVTQRMQKLPA